MQSLPPILINVSASQVNKLYRKLYENLCFCQLWWPAHKLSKPRLDARKRTPYGDVYSEVNKANISLMPGANYCLCRLIFLLPHLCRAGVCFWRDPVCCVGSYVSLNDCVNACLTLCKHFISTYADSADGRHSCCAARVWKAQIDNRLHLLLHLLSQR